MVNELSLSKYPYITNNVLKKHVPYEIRNYILYWYQIEILILILQKLKCFKFLFKDL